jgi:hypothetical protein
VTEHGTEDIQPITIQDSVNRNLTLLAVAMETNSESRLLQPAMVSAQADFIPRFVSCKLYSVNKFILNNSKGSSLVDPVLSQKETREPRESLKRKSEEKV